MCFFMIRSWHTICALEAGGQTCALPICYCRFRESDNRSRTGKQLCHRDDSPDMIGSTPTREANPGVIYANYQGVRAAMFSTGCKAGSLYDDAAFGTPNGLALNYVNGFAFADFTFGGRRSEEHTSELQSLMRISYAVFCLKKKNQHLSR